MLERSLIDVFLQRNKHHQKYARYVPIPTIVNYMAVLLICIGNILNLEG